MRTLRNSRGPCISVINDVNVIWPLTLNIRLKDGVREIMSEIKQGAHTADKSCARKGSSAWNGSSCRCGPSDWLILATKAIARMTKMNTVNWIKLNYEDIPAEIILNVDNPTRVRGSVTAIRRDLGCCTEELNRRETLAECSWAYCMSREQRKIFLVGKEFKYCWATWHIVHWRLLGPKFGKTDGSKGISTNNSCRRSAIGSKTQIYVEIYGFVKI